MPEGDSVAGNAEMLRPILDGRVVVAVDGTSPSVRSNSRRLLDSRVTGVRTVGKNLIVDFSSGYSLHVHLGMTGRWHQHAKPGARIALTTDAGIVSCSNAPTVDVGRTAAIDRKLAALGPDLLGDFDVDEFVRRARLVEPMAIARLLLDQRVIAGIGNVYKSELLFLAGIHPRTMSSDVEDIVLTGIALKAQELLAANVGQRRTTTGSARRGQETWVYAQAGHGCRRCGTRIESGRLDGRITYWCPTCQPRS